MKNETNGEIDVDKTLAAFLAFKWNKFSELDFREAIKLVDNSPWTSQKKWKTKGMLLEACAAIATLEGQPLIKVIEEKIRPDF